MTLLEKIARQIWANQPHDDEDGPSHWEDLFECERQDWISGARGVLNFLRDQEIPERVVHEGSYALQRAVINGDNNPQKAGVVFHAMLAAIAEERPEEDETRP